MTHIISIRRLSESVAHIPLRHALIPREEMDTPVRFNQGGQEFLDKLCAEPIATIRFVESEVINIHAST